MIRAVRFAVDRERAGPANSFAAIRIERDRLFALAQSALRSPTSSISRNDVFGETFVASYSTSLPFVFGSFWRQTLSRKFMVES